MIQEQITICFPNGQERQFPKEYDMIMNELKTEQNQIWFLIDIDYQVYIIDNISLKYSSKLIAIQPSDITFMFNCQLKFKELEIQNVQLEEEISKLKQNSQQLQELGQIIPQKYIQEGKLIEQLELKQKEIDKLKKHVQTIENQLKSLKEVEQQQKSDLKTKYQQLTNQESTYTFQILSLQQENLQFSQTIDQLQQDNLQQTAQISSLQQEKQQFSQQIDKLKQENLQQTAKIALLSTQSQAELIQIQIEPQYLSIQPSSTIRENLGQQQSHTPITQQIAEELNNFYSDEQKQCREINFNYQIRYLESLIQKVSDDKIEEQKMNSRQETSQAIIFSEWLNIYQILLDEDQFSKSIKEKNFYFRKNCLIKNRVSQIKQRQLNQDTEIVIKIDNQNLTIKSVYDTCNAEYQALDIILNILLIEGYAKLYERDLQKANSQNQLREQWSFKIPRQFLIQDDIGNYHIYQEYFGDNIGYDFSPFQTAGIDDQFISSFFQIFLSCNQQEFKLKYKITSLLNKVVILKIAIHSKYKNLFSQLDKGKEKIINFERILSQYPPGAIQQYWSDQLEILAEKVWYGQ